MVISKPDDIADNSFCACCCCCGHSYCMCPHFTGKQSLSDCVPCTPGSYCETTGLSEPTDLCDEGWYCVRAAVSSRPFDIGNTSYTEANVTVNCFCSINETGGMCAPGEYCPRGSSRPLDCEAGKKLISSPKHVVELSSELPLWSLVFSAATLSIMLSLFGICV